MSEKNPTKSAERRPESTAEQQREDHEQQERLRQDVERRAEQSKAERSQEVAAERRNVERLVESAERPQDSKAESAPAETERTTPARKSERQQAYEAIMSDARADMPPAQRAFSKLIHNRVVESTSEVVGSTVARPNAILSGSFTAFIVVLGVYLVARHYGYPLSGSETIIAFAGGWLIGLLFDYLRTLISGRH